MTKTPILRTHHILESASTYHTADQKSWQTVTYQLLDKMADDDRGRDRLNTPFLILPNTLTGNQIKDLIAW